MIAPRQALALRRLLLAASALTGTLVAHALCATGLTIAPAAPAIWGSIVCIAVLAGPRGGSRWREWSALGLLARLLAVELSLHLVLTVAPWALGVTPHHSSPLVTPTIVMAHGAVALLLGLALTGAQGLLSAAQRVVRAVRRALRVAPAAAAPRLAADHLSQIAPTSLSHRPRGARGPPEPAL